MSDKALRTSRVLGSLRFRFWLSWAFATVMATSLTGIAFAQEESHSNVRANLTADRNVVTVGEVVVLTLEVTHPAEHAVVIPRLSREWGAFEVVSQSTARTDSNGNGTETTRQSLEVAFFAPGTFETPELSISIRRPDGAVDRVVPSRVRLTVRSVLPGSDELLKGLRPPADLSPPLWKHPVVLAIAALAVVASMASGAYLIHHHLRARAAQPESEGDTRTPWEVAIQEIDGIERLDLPGEGRFKEHYALIFQVMQTYVRATFLENGGRPDATDMTTDEIGTAVWQSSLDRKNARLVVDLLLEADLVRFSNYPSSESEAYGALSQARDIVRDTKAVPVEAPREEDTVVHPEAAT